MDDFKKALWEATKEPLRILVLAALTFIIDWLLQNIAQFKLNTAEQAVILVALRYADKFLHEWGKETDSEVLTKGITQF